MSELRGILLVILGLISLGYYYSWWFQDGRLRSPWLILGLVVALCYGIIQLLFSWVIYLATHHRPTSTLWSNADLTIDVFVTACGEDKELVCRTLAAACAMHGEHRTWLLDDGKDPILAQLAERLGAGYITRKDRRESKAGNINAALAQTDGDIIVMFDIDHAPRPTFLEETLGFFSDPAIGFIQVMLTFENGNESWVAEAATETSYDYYNPISIGADSIKGTTLVGTNALIRRKALGAIGGYQTGLADDLETSIALHAAGWRSYYVYKPLAPGYAPPDLTAWFTQQFKWARGVFEALLTTYPRNFARLTGGQRLFYPVRLTYYWLGPVVCIHLLMTLFTLLSGNRELMRAFEQYLAHFLPLSAVAILIRLLALRRWRHESLSRSLQWKPVALVYLTWPIYTAAWIMAMLRIPLRYRPTPKTRTGSINQLWIAPQTVTSLLLIWGLSYSFSFDAAWVSEIASYGLLIGFATAQAAVQVILLGYLLFTAMMNVTSTRMAAKEAHGREVSPPPRNIGRPLPGSARISEKHDL